MNDGLHQEGSGGALTVWLEKSWHEKTTPVNNVNQDKVFASTVWDGDTNQGDRRLFFLSLLSPPHSLTLQRLHTYPSLSFSLAFSLSHPAELSDSGCCPLAQQLG
jgi:hypothetical protein